MTKIFWSLVKIRLSLLLFSGKRTNQSSAITTKRVLGKVPKIILIALLATYCVGVFLAMFVSLFYSLGMFFGGTELEWFYFAVAGIISFALSFVGSVFATQTQIYDARDNELLLSMPVPIKYILASRMVALFVMNLLYDALVMLPAIVVWAILGNYTVASAVGSAVLFIVVMLLSVSLSCIVGWLIALLTSKVKRKNLVTTVLSMLALVTYFVVYSFAMNYVEELLYKGEEIAVAIKNGFYPAYLLGIIGNGDYLAMVITALSTVAVFVIIYAVLDKTFIQISTAKTGTVRIKYKAKKLKESKSATIAFVKKEFSHYISNPMYIMNATIGVIFSFIAAGYLAFKGGELIGTFMVMGLPESFLSLFAITIATFLVSYNVVSAPSISLEAKTLWLLQSLPVDPSDIMLAKAWNHFLVCEVGVIVVGISAAIFIPVSAIVKILIFVIPTLFNAFCALFGVIINLLLPKFNWINETVAIKQGISTLVCMFAPMGVIALYILPYLLWVAPYMHIVVYTLIFAILLVIASFVEYSYLTGKAKERFLKLGQ